jgi:hypothetical protein
VPSYEKVFVSVVNSATKMIAEKKVYQIQVEVDSSQTQALSEMKQFLDSKFAESKT